MLIHAAHRQRHLPAALRRHAAKLRARSRSRRDGTTCARCAWCRTATAAPAEERAGGVELVRRKAWQTSVAWRLERLGLAPLFSAEARAPRASRGLPRGARRGRRTCSRPTSPLAGLLDDSRAALRVYTSQNVEYDRFVDRRPDCCCAARWARGAARARGARRCRRADLTVVCTDEDAARMRELYGAARSAVAVMPERLRRDRAARTRRPASASARAARSGWSDGEYCAVFVGADWGPIATRSRWLVDRVLPSLARDRVRLLVVGAVSRALAGRREPWLQRGRRDARRCCRCCTRPTRGSTRRAAAAAAT